MTPSSRLRVGLQSPRVQRILRVRASIIIPTLNRPRQLLMTVGALVAQITENGVAGEVEIVVVDDGGEPETGRWIRERLSSPPHPFLRLVALERQHGASFARNVGIQASRGDLLIFLDDDIVPANDYLSKTLHIHDLHPEILVLNGNLRPLRDDQYSRFWFRRYATVFNVPGRDVHEVPMISSGNLSVKKALLEVENPLFDENLVSREDYDLYLRLKARGIPIYKAEGVVAYNGCRETIGGFLRQHVWYLKGEEQLEVKYGARRMAEERSGRRFPRSRRHLHLHLLLRLITEARAIRARFRC